MEKPNLLFILTDQQRFDTLGCMGNPVIQTPHLDQLAREGTLFRNNHCTHPLCMPSRATLLTGRYVRSHHLYRNGVPLNEQELTVSQMLKANGYRTGLIGKAHFTPSQGDPALHPEAVRFSNGVSKDDCWKFWEGFKGPYYGFDHLRMTLGHGDRGMVGGHYGHWLHQQHPELVPLFEQEQALEPTDPQYPSWKSAVPLHAHPATWITKETIEFIEADKEQPFYAWVGFQEPHVPFNPPEPYCSMYDPATVPLPKSLDEAKQQGLPEHILYYFNKDAWKRIDEQKTREIIAHYYGMVTMIDDCVGKIVSYLKAAGLDDNTIIVFTSDHGEWLGDHGLWLKGAVHTQEVTRVPLILRWPGAGTPGTVVDHVVSLVDVVPTLLDAAGVDQDYGIQGQSLRTSLEGDLTNLRPYALIEHRHEPHPISARFEQESAIINKSNSEFRMKTMITNAYRISYIGGKEYGELYDLLNDPEENHNLWFENVDLRNEQLLKLLDVLVETEDPLPKRQFSV